MVLLSLFVRHLLDGRQLSAQELLVDLVVLRRPRLKFFHLANELCKMEVLNLSSQKSSCNVRQPPRLSAAIAHLVFDLHRQRKERKLQQSYRVIKGAANRGVTPSEMHLLFLERLLV